jgi:hypothetical protein
MEDRISELQDKIEIKQKADEMLVKQLKSLKGIYRKSLTPSKDQT